MKLKTSTALATLLLLIPTAPHAAETVFFPDLNAAKQAYKAQDYTTAAKNWMPLAHKGIPAAQVELGKLYTRGLGVKQNNKTALNLFIRASEKNNEQAMFEIGKIYEKGTGVPKDVHKAKEWYQLAANNGYSRGHYAIGRMYEKNKFNPAPTITPDTKTNIKNAVNSIKDGNYSQAEYLATLYQQGLNVPKNNEQALTYLIVAKNTGSLTAADKITNIQTKVSLDEYLSAQNKADLLLAEDNKDLKDARQELVRNLKRIKRPAESPKTAQLREEKALTHYKKSAQQGYKRSAEKISNITGEPIADLRLVPKPEKKKYRIITSLKTQFVGEENMDLGTQNNDAETSLILNGQIGAYLSPTDDITTYTEVRGLHSTGVATSSNGDDDDTSDLSFIEMRQAWVEFDHLFGIQPAALKLGRQRFYEPRALWWNRDLDAVKLSLNSTLTNGFIAIGENQNKYRLGDENDLERDEEDRLRILGELSHQYAPSHVIEGRLLWEDDHSDVEAIGQNIPTDDRDDEDYNLLWTGIRLAGKVPAPSPSLQQFGYRADLLGVAGKETIVTTTAGPSADLRTVSAVNDRDVLGWAFDGSIDFQFDNILEPTVTFGYAYGSGDDGSGDNNGFRQSGMEGNSSRFPEGRTASSLRNYGEVLRPELSNIHIANAGINLPLFSASDININYFSYWLDEKGTSLRSSSISAPINGQDAFLGQALDVATTINIGKELNITSPVFRNTALRINLGGFKAGDAYGQASGEYAYRGSTELRIKF